jgi:hypothetical protein
MTGEVTQGGIMSSIYCFSRVSKFLILLVSAFGMLVPPLAWGTDLSHYSDSKLSVYLRDKHLFYFAAHDVSLESVDSRMANDVMLHVLMTTLIDDMYHLSSLFQLRQMIVPYKNTIRDYKQPLEFVDLMIKSEIGSNEMITQRQDLVDNISQKIPHVKNAGLVNELQAARDEMSEAIDALNQLQSRFK